MGQAIPATSTLHANFPVPVSIPTGPSSPFFGDWNISIYPADATTFAGGGSNHTDISFGVMGGLAAVDDVAYIATDSSIVAVNLKTGASSYLAGTATQEGCVAATDPAAVRFRGPPGDVATDGHDLFVANGCGISKVSLPSGSTTLLTPWSGPLSFGPDGRLYAGSYAEGKASIMQIDPTTGATKPYLSFPAGSYVMGLAADGQSLWASVDEGPSAPAVMDQIMFASGAVTRFAVQGVDVVGAGQLVSSGPYLYGPAVGGVGILQFTKQYLTWGLAVGGNPGDEDGVWHEATFAGVRGIASDGRELWVTDAPNHQLRVVRFNSAIALQIGGG